MNHRVDIPDHATFTVIDAPGAGTLNSQGTYATCINTSGTIAGYYADQSNVYHGFIRSAAGDYTAVDAPGAGTGQYLGTMVYGINTAGAITGNYFDSASVYHSFIRQADGALVSFDVTGYYADSGTVYNGFRRSPSGTITEIDFPGAARGIYQGTEANSINAMNDLAG
ncbi:MAG TPA: hypothetical protein VMR62_17805 [Bryobacteraceae bacterium]|nr:hypothetical protein [Bryobacteraceae bacterium]